jgi:hypothetical protein
MFYWAGFWLLNWLVDEHLVAMLSGDYFGAKYLENLTCFAG